jgi:hypothetical protein
MWSDMPDEVVEVAGTRVLSCAPDGPTIDSEAGVLDLIGLTFEYQVDTVAIPAGRLAPAFFSLRSGLAGNVLQKFANYRARLVVLGDISARVAASTALRDLVHEANQGQHIWFLPDLDALTTRLTTRLAPPPVPSDHEVGRPISPRS